MEVSGKDAAGSGCHFVSRDLPAIQDLTTYPPSLYFSTGGFFSHTGVTGEAPSPATGVSDLDRNRVPISLGLQSNQPRPQELGTSGQWMVKGT